jgi:glycosyltransferase involved in cell wall biosynthesis
VLKVLHVGKYYPPVPGGMERVVQMLCTVARDRLDSRVLGFSRDRSTIEEIVDGVAVTRVATLGQAGSVPIAPSFAAHLRRAAADVMIVHEPNPWALLSLLLAPPRIPFAIWFHSDVIRPWLQYRAFYEPVARRSYHRAARFVVSSPALAKASPVLTRYADRIAVIPFGIDADAWTPCRATVERAAALRTAARRPIVLFIGRLVAYKGVDVLLAAAAALPVQVVIVGEGPMKERWQRLADSHRDRAEVRFTGALPDHEVKAWLHAADIFVLPSVTSAEAFGVVQLEAMATGTPVVSTSVASGVPWVNRNEETGLVVPPGDVPALRHALERLLADSMLRSRLGAAGVARVRSEFTLAAMGDRLVALCEAVAGNVSRT